VLQLKSVTLQKKIWPIKLGDACPCDISQIRKKIKPQKNNKILVKIIFMKKKFRWKKYIILLYKMKI
jgi:hypothetical protein